MEFDGVVACSLRRNTATEVNEVLIGRNEIINNAVRILHSAIEVSKEKMLCWTELCIV